MAIGDFHKQSALFKLAPLATDANYTLSPDGEPPAWSLALPGMRLSWRIAPAFGERAKLTDGDLKDAEGRASVSIGEILPTGGGMFGGRPRLGVMAWYEGGSGEPESYVVNIVVTPETFQRLLSWCQQGKLPSLQVSLTPFCDDEQPEPPEGVLGSDYSGIVWDNKRQPHLEISWFTLEWPLNNPADMSADDSFSSQPVSAKLFSQGVNKIHESIAKLTLPLWIMCGLLAAIAASRLT